MAAPQKYLVKARKYKVQDGDSIKSLAESSGITWQELARFNWGTDNPDKINIFLRDKVGCRKKTKDGHNYVFTSKDDPGIIYIPEDFPEKSFAHSSTHVIQVKAPGIKTFIPAKCYVNFRPKASWTGEYGFDWMREGDFPISVAPKIGDIKYADIIGKHYVTESPGCLSLWGLFGKGKSYVQPNGNKYDDFKDFRKHPELYEKLKEEYKKGFKEADAVEMEPGKKIANYGSYLSIYADDDEIKLPQSVEIQAQMYVKESPEELQFVYDSSKYASPPLVITPEKIKKPGVNFPGNPQKETIKIECKAPLKAPVIIQAKSVFRDTDGSMKEEIVGQLTIMANDMANLKTTNLLVVDVSTPQSGSLKGQMRGGPANESDFLKKTLRQALIKPIIENVHLDLSTDTTFRDKYIVAGEITGTDVDDYMKVELKKVLRAKYPGVSITNKYKKHLIIFCFGEKSGDNLNGYSSGQHIVMYKGRIESTAVHEVLHSLGIPHSFDGTTGGGVHANTRFTYHAQMTENILDYTHHRGVSHYKARISLWRWQWEVARAVAASGFIAEVSKPTD